MGLLPSPASERWRMFLCWAEPRDGFIVPAGCYQGGSANTTADEERLLYSTFTKRGVIWGRRRISTWLTMSRGLRSCPFGCSGSRGIRSVGHLCMGWVDMDDPMRVINPNYRTKGNLWWLVLLWWQTGIYLAGRTRLVPAEHVIETNLMAKIFPPKILPRRIGLRTGGPFSDLGSYFSNPNLAFRGAPSRLIYLLYTARSSRPTWPTWKLVLSVCLSVCDPGSST